MNVFFPHILCTSVDKLSLGAVEVTRQQLLDYFEVHLNVTGGFYQKIFLHKGFENYNDPYQGFFIGVGEDDLFSKGAASTALEILAHHFQDYAIRESICGKGLKWIFELSNPKISEIALQNARISIAPRIQTSYPGIA